MARETPAAGRTVTRSQGISIIWECRSGPGAEQGRQWGWWLQKEVANLLPCLPEDLSSPHPNPSPHWLGHLGMQALVGNEVGALLETLVALAAAKGPLARVYAPMVQQVGAE